MASGKLKTAFDKVKMYLEQDAVYRDSDEKLVSRYQNDELGGDDESKKITAYAFLVKHARGEVTSADIITRARRKVQELDENAHLRGKKWYKRHNIAAPEIKDELNSISA